MLVCVGSCLIMIVSQYGFSNILTHQNVVLDPSRIAAQVVSGIGFLGAGAILARGEIVKGLTTAASIWTVAAVGLAVGGGLYLTGARNRDYPDYPWGIKPLEEAYRSRNQSCQLRVEVEKAEVSRPNCFERRLVLRGGQIKRFLVESRNPDSTDELVILLSKVSSHDIATFPDKLKELDGVREVTIMKKSKDHAPS